MGKMIRLDRFLTDMGKGTRSEIREAARKGRIQVNQKTEKRTDRKIDPKEDQVVLDGKPVQYRSVEYFLLNKPKGVVSATEDKRYPTVVELLGEDRRKDLFPVGRLDLDTEGLLLLTNDGDLAHRLLSPKKHVDKRYYARVSGTLPEDAARQMEEGMVLTDGTRVLPARLEVLSEGRRERSEEEGQKPSAEEDSEEKMPDTEVFLTIREGRFHQVKRMFEAMGCRVTYLKRVSMGPLKLDEELKPGQFRRLTEEEIALLGGDRGEEGEEQT